MSISVAAALASALMAGAPEMPPEALVDTFSAACLDGAVNLKPDQASAITYKDLPYSLRSRFGKPVSSQVWRLNSPGRAYFFVLNFEPGKITSRMICGLASEEMPLTNSAEALRARLGGPPIDQTSPNTEWMFPDAGYFAVAARAAGFTILQVRWLSDEQKNQALWEFRTIGARVPKAPAGTVEK